MEKGGIHYIRHNFWPLRTFFDLRDVQNQADQWRDDVANVRQAPGYHRYRHVKWYGNRIDGESLSATFPAIDVVWYGMAKKREI